MGQSPNTWTEEGPAESRTGPASSRRAPERSSGSTSVTDAPLDPRAQTLVDTDVKDGSAFSARLRAQRDEVHARLFGPAPGQDRIGRYLVLGTLGQGGMGKVLRAHDETLDRDVALKVLHEGGGSGHEQRLLREAQALARLSHPNVVAVFDVDQIDDRLCMAMELVHGQSLDVWQAAPRSWTEVLEIYLQAGRGLAAAHAEGIVHRDFKPANCILDSRGVVKVLDFGLARGVGVDDEAAAAEAERTLHSGTGAEPSASDSLRASSSQQMLDQVLTRTGAMLGTPAYMAPEQLLGKAAEPASDQFSFCVSIYEAVYGQRPFSGGTAMAILYSIQTKQLSAAVARAGLPPVPRWLLEVLQRGLSLTSQQRYPSMEALLEALERGLTRRRRTRRATVGLGLVAGLGATLALSGVLEGEGPCAAVREGPMPGWTAPEQAAVQAALETSDPHAEQGPEQGAPEESAGPRVVAALDAYAADWVEARVDACEATWVRREAGEQALARRMACLDERLPHVHAIVERLTDADPQIAARAVEAVSALPSIAPCRDAQALLRGLDPVPEDRVAQADEIRRLIARSWAADATGDQHGLEAANRAVEAAQALPDVPSLQLDARRNRGSIHRRARRFTEAREDLEVALDLAERLDDPSRSIDVLRELINLADDERDVGVATAWLAAIRGKLARVEDHPRFRALRWVLEAQVALRARDVDEAAEASAHAVELYDAMDEPPLDEHFDALLLLGEARRRQGDLEGARQAIDRSLDLAEHSGRILLRARVRYRLGYLHYLQGQLEEAQQVLEQALADRDAFHGPRAVASARTRLLLAQILRIQGESIKAFEQASITRQSLDERSPAQIRAEVSSLLASLHRMHEQWDPAIESYREARVALADTATPDRVEMALLDSNIADCLVARGDLDAAGPIYEGTLRTLELDTSPDDPRRAYPLMGLGELALAKDEPDAAVGFLRRVLELEAALQRDPALDATARWTLARALRPSARASAEDTREAAALAHEARAAFEAAAVPPVVEQIDAWLQECGTACAQPEESESPPTANEHETTRTDP